MKPADRRLIGKDGMRMNDLISRQAAIDALDEIRHALWEIDIPSPTVPEYVEHHEQVQSVWKLLDKKQKELYVLPSAQPEIIRCKDCKNYYFADNRVPSEQSWVCAAWGIDQTAHMGYCFKAERKEE